MAAHYQEFVVHVARALAEQPERVQVEELPAADGARGSNLRLVVAPEDVGRLVGRRGRTANALRGRGDIAGAIDGYRHTVELEPDHYAAHRALAFLWQAAGRRDRALDHFARTMELRRGEDRTGIADVSLTHTTRGKLRHDAAQFRHIAARGRDAARYEVLARSYEAAAEMIADGTNASAITTLTAAQLDLLGERYNTPFHVIDAPERKEITVNPALDRGAITAAYREAFPGIAWFDGLLTPDALARLRRYLLESTIWFDFTHIGGFLATYLEDGLACPLIEPPDGTNRFTSPE